MPADLSKLLEHDKADAKRAAVISKELEPRLKGVSKESLLHTQEHFRLDEMLNAELVAATDGFRWYSVNNAYDGNGRVGLYQSTDSGGTVEASCGAIILGFGYSNEMNPRSYAVGSGYGWDDYNSVTSKCWLWFFIPSAYVARPGTLYVSLF